MAEPGDLWSFSLEIYDQPGVEDLCLYLQDHHHLPVSLLLWCCWLEVEQRPLSATDLATARERVRETDRLLSEDLRRLRRTLKEVELLREEAQREIRHHILQAELYVEKEVLTELQAMSLPPSEKVDAPTPLQRLSTDWHLPQAEQWLHAIRTAAARVARD